MSEKDILNDIANLKAELERIVKLVDVLEKKVNGMNGLKDNQIPKPEETKQKPETKKKRKKKKKEEVFSIDVQCGATGIGCDESDRAVMSVTVVDINGNKILDCLCKPPAGKEFVSTLEAISGVKKDDIKFEESKSLEEVQDAIDQIFLKAGSCTVVSQHPGVIQKRLQLPEASQDLKYVYLYETICKNDRSWSLQQVAKVILNESYESSKENKSQFNADVAMKLFKKVGHDDKALKKVCNRMSTLPRNMRLENPVKSSDYNIDGVCLANFMPEKCFCKNRKS